MKNKIQLFEGSQLVSNTIQLKMLAPDGKMQNSLGKEAAPKKLLLIKRGRVRGEGKLREQYTMQGYFMTRVTHLFDLYHEMTERLFAGKNGIRKRGSSTDGTK